MITKIKKTGAIFMTCLICITYGYGQHKLVEKESLILIKGTSTLHDWRCKVEKLSGTLELQKTATSVESIQSMPIVMKVESIKSIKENNEYYSTSMDKNTYKALKSSTYPQIKFELKKNSTITGKGTVNGLATITIVGISKDIPILFTTLIQPNGSILISGKKDIKMTDFSIDPPKAMLGTIKTGDAITVEFKLVYK